MYLQHNKTGVWNKICTAPFSVPRSVLSIPDFPIKLSSSLSIASGRRKKEEERRSGPWGHTTGAEEAPFLSICRWLFVCLRWFPRYYGRRRCHERANRDVKEKKEAPCFPLYISDNFFGIHMHEIVCFYGGNGAVSFYFFWIYFFSLCGVWCGKVHFNVSGISDLAGRGGWPFSSLPSLLNRLLPPGSKLFSPKGRRRVPLQTVSLFSIRLFLSLFSRIRQRGLQNVKSGRSFAGMF